MDNLQCYPRWRVVPQVTRGPLQVVCGVLGVEIFLVASSHVVGTVWICNYVTVLRKVCVWVLYKPHILTQRHLRLTFVRCFGGRRLSSSLVPVLVVPRRVALSHLDDKLGHLVPASCLPAIHCLELTCVTPTGSVACFARYHTLPRYILPGL